MKRVYESPKACAEIFTANEYIAACYDLACSVGAGGNPPYGFKWNREEYGSDVSHSKPGTADTCADSTANRVITGEGGTFHSIGEYNGEQGWINGALDYWKDVNENGRYDTGDVVYWHTLSGNNDRRWNHWGTIAQADPNHPNHS